MMDGCHSCNVSIVSARPEEGKPPSPTCTLTCVKLRKAPLVLSPLQLLVNGIVSSNAVPEHLLFYLPLGDFLLLGSGRLLLLATAKWLSGRQCWCRLK